MDILERIRELKEKVKSEFSDVKNLDELEDLRIKYLGKKGEVQKIFNKMSEIEDEKKPVVGKETNILDQL